MASAIWLVLPERVQCEKWPRLEQITFGPIGEIEPNISPDGQWLAFQYFHKNELSSTQIWVMEISKGFRSARRLVTMLDYAGEMSWSPDSKWISFISSEYKLGLNTNQIYKVSVFTNEVIQITAFPVGTLIGDSTTWSTNGLIGFERDGIIYSISPTGGKEVQLLDTRTALSNQRRSYIRFSPGGTKLVFSVENAEQDQSSIWLADLETNSFRQLTGLHFDLFPSWIDEEHIVFTRQNRNRRSEVETLSLRTGILDRITSNHEDLTPSTDPSGSVLYFSRGGAYRKNFAMLTSSLAFTFGGCPFLS
jgi:Tol biopolymer transport system component